jgi:hypothetical protein
MLIQVMLSVMFARRDHDGWELEWVEDDDGKHHRWPPMVFLRPASLIPLFQNSELLLYGKNFGL